MVLIIESLLVMNSNKKIYCYKVDKDSKYTIQYEAILLESN